MSKIRGYYKCNRCGWETDYTSNKELTTFYGMHQKHCHGRSRSHTDYVPEQQGGSWLNTIVVLGLLIGAVVVAILK